MSILKFLPWDSLDATKQQQCFELIQMSLDALSTHLDRGNSPVTPDLFYRIIETTEKYVKLTPKQALYIEDLKDRLLLTVYATKPFEMAEEHHQYCLENLVSKKDYCTKEELTENIKKLEDIIAAFKQQLSLINIGGCI